MPVTRGQLQDLVASKAADPAYRQALKADPQGVIAGDLRTEIPATMKFRVLEETADTLYVVLPARPASEFGDSQLDQVAGGNTILSLCLAPNSSINSSFVS